MQRHGWGPRRASFCALGCRGLASPRPARPGDWRLQRRRKRFIEQRVSGYSRHGGQCCHSCTERLVHIAPFRPRNPLLSPETGRDHLARASPRRSGRWRRHLDPAAIHQRRRPRRRQEERPGRTHRHWETAVRLAGGGIRQRVGAVMRGGHLVAYRRQERQRLRRRRRWRSPIPTAVSLSPAAASG